jgi:hypothetical protein
VRISTRKRIKLVRISPFQVDQAGENRRIMLLKNDIKPLPPSECCDEFDNAPHRAKGNDSVGSRRRGVTVLHLHTLE